MTKDELRRLADNGDSLIAFVAEVLPRCTKRQQERGQFLLNVIKGAPNAALFPVDVDKAERLTIFRNSTVADYNVFAKHFPDEKYPGIDILYYYEAVLTWSNMKKGIVRDEKGWVATARNFMRLDHGKKKLRMVNGKASMINDELEFLKKGYGG